MPWPEGRDPSVGTDRCVRVFVRRLTDCPGADNARIQHETVDRSESLNGSCNKFAYTVLRCSVGNEWDGAGGSGDPLKGFESTATNGNVPPLAPG